MWISCKIGFRLLGEEIRPRSNAIYFNVHAPNPWQASKIDCDSRQMHTSVYYFHLNVRLSRVIAKWFVASQKMYCQFLDRLRDRFRDTPRVNLRPETASPISLYSNVRTKFEYYSSVWLFSIVVELFVHRMSMRILVLCTCLQSVMWSTYKS